MSFDQWCESKQIRDNWKEALYHSLAAKYGGIMNIPEDEQVWAEEWRALLSRIMGQAYGAVYS